MGGGGVCAAVGVQSLYCAHRHGMETKRAMMMLLAAYQCMRLPQVW